MKYENFKNEVYLVRKCQRCVKSKEDVSGEDSSNEDSTN